MPQTPGGIEAIPKVPHKELNSISQIDLPTLSRAFSRKPAYKAYKTLIGYRHTLQRLHSHVNLRVEQADDALHKASKNLHNTAIALVNACSSPMSFHPESHPHIMNSEVLKGVLELQKYHQGEKMDALVKCRCEQMHVQSYIQTVSEILEKDERALVKNFGVHTVDDEGKPLLS